MLLLMVILLIFISFMFVCFHYSTADCFFNFVSYFCLLCNVFRACLKSELK
jgi:hypothetical protein